MLRIPDPVFVTRYACRISSPHSLFPLSGSPCYRQKFCQRRSCWFPPALISPTAPNATNCQCQEGYPDSQNAKPVTYASHSNCSRCWPWGVPAPADGSSSSGRPRVAATQADAAESDAAWPSGATRGPWRRDAPTAFLSGFLSALSFLGGLDHGGARWTEWNGGPARLDLDTAGRFGARNQI